MPHTEQQPEHAIGLLDGILLATAGTAPGGLQAHVVHPNRTTPYHGTFRFRFTADPLSSIAKLALVVNDDDLMDELDLTAAHAAAAALSLDRSADVFLLNGVIDDAAFDQVDALSRSSQSRTVVLCLITNGGDPHAGYRIARTLKRRYERFIVLVPGLCKSAGTLITLGADELVMTDAGELGPLDIQLWSREHLGQLDSANDMTLGLTHLGVAAMDRFIECFGVLAADLETTTAAEAASKLVGRTYGRVFESVHPRQIGAVARSSQIGFNYAKRLLPPSPESDEAIHKLVFGYPAHEFVIDREEAAELLPNVRPPQLLEADLADALLTGVSETTFVLRLAPTLPNPQEIEHEITHVPPRPASRSHEGSHREHHLRAQEAHRVREEDGGGAQATTAARPGPTDVAAGSVGLEGNRGSLRH